MDDVHVGSQRRESEAFDSSEQARHEALYRNDQFSKSFLKKWSNVATGGHLQCRLKSEEIKSHDFTDAGCLDGSSLSLTFSNFLEAPILHPFMCHTDSRTDSLLPLEATRGIAS